MRVTPEIERALSKAKVALMCSKDGVFISTVMLGLGHVWDDTISTACTDGRRHRYNPEFFMSLSEKVRQTLLFHETWHVVLQHSLRLMLRNHGRYNRAGDYVINALALRANMELGHGWLYDSQYENMSTEQVYDLLDDEEEDYALSGDVVPSDPNDSTIQMDIDGLLIQAAMQAKAAKQWGSVPGEVQVYIDGLLNPIVPWHRHLGPFLTRLVRTGYNYTKANRRYRPKYFLPTPLSNALCDIAIAADISGSTADGFPQFIAETVAVLKNYHPDKIHFLTFDTKIQTEKVIRSTRDVMSIEFTGLGGTELNPVMQWAVDNKPNAIIIFTDGYYATPTIKPKCPVIWVVYNNPDYEAPFGKLIHFTINE